MTAVLARLLTVLHILFGIVAIGGSIIALFLTGASEMNFASWVLLSMFAGGYLGSILDRSVLAPLGEALSKAPLRTFSCFLWADLVATLFMLYLITKPDKGGELVAVSALYLFAAATPTIVLFGVGALLKWVAHGSTR